jgi:hypothetical protein
MHQIILDFFRGVKASVEIPSLINLISVRPSVGIILWRIMRFNLLCHMVPGILMYYLSTGPTINFIIGVIINLISFIFHLIHNIDLVSNLDSNQKNSDMSTLDCLTLAITMSIYQIAIWLATSLVSFLLSERLYYLSILINFLSLSIYHSMYCFNNSWQKSRIMMYYRIDMLEKLWPYYVGYGTIATIICMMINNQIVTAIYNCYLTTIIIIPFCIDHIYPKHEMPYLSVNLSIFSWLSDIILIVTKYVLE